MQIYRAYLDALLLFNELFYFNALQIHLRILGCIFTHTWMHFQAVSTHTWMHPYAYLDALLRILGCTKFSKSKAYCGFQESTYNYTYNLLILITYNLLM